jgi:hypothetical protein
MDIQVTDPNVRSTGKAGVWMPRAHRYPGNSGGSTVMHYPNGIEPID